MIKDSSLIYIPNILLGATAIQAMLSPRQKQET